MPKKRSGYLIRRNQGGAVRFYGDFRPWTDVGGRVEALIQKGTSYATTDETVAHLIVAERIKELEERRIRKQMRLPESDTFFAPYCLYHLKQKRLSGKVSGQWLEAAAGHLEAAITFLCNSGKPLPRDENDEVILTGIRNREVGSITTVDIQDYTRWLSQQDNGRGDKLSPSSCPASVEM